MIMLTRNIIVDMQNDLFKSHVNIVIGHLDTNKYYVAR